jgi:Concanavalin A-like lectin/glucanases superfamily/N-terminal domain of M60-like peptidases/Peptidase M60, enhancin and enhancin-like
MIMLAGPDSRKLLHAISKVTMRRHHSLLTQICVTILLSFLIGYGSNALGALSVAIPPVSALAGCAYSYPLPAVTGCDGIVLTDAQYSSSRSAGITATVTPSGLAGVRLDYRQTIRLKNESCLQLGNGGSDFSVSMWVKPPNGISQILSSGISPYGSAGGGFVLHTVMDNGRAKFIMHTASAAGGRSLGFSSTPIDAGTWAYVTVTYVNNGDASYATMTVNGVTTSGAVYSEPFKGALVIGDNAGWGAFNAVEIADMRAYGRALTVAEIRAQWLVAAPYFGVTAAALETSIDQLSAHLSGTAPLSAASLAAVAASVTKNAVFLPTSESLMVKSLNLAELFETNRGPLFVSPATASGILRVPDASEAGVVTEARIMLNDVFQMVHDEVFREESVAVCSAMVQGRRWKTADYFPGKVTATLDPSRTFTVPVNATVPAVWGIPVAYATAPKTRATGLYLPPGSVARVTVPQALVNAGFAVQIGAHTADHTGKRVHTRLDRVTRRFEIRQAVTFVANPLGGGVYIEVPYLATAGMVSVQVQGVVEAPIFSLRSFDTSTVADWTTRRTAGAPWTDLVTDHFMMQVPANYVYAKADPTQLLRDWDTLMKTFSTFVGIPPEKRNDVTMWLQTDVQIRHSAFGVGYPQINLVYNPTSVQNGNNQSWFLTNPMAGCQVECHELGHAQLFSGFRGEGEAINNFPFAYIANTQFGYTFDEAFRVSFNSHGPTGGFTPDRAAVDWMVTVNFGNAAEMDYSNTTKDEFRYQERGYAKYADIARLFGWKVLTDFYAKENVDYNARTPGDGLSAVDSRILRLSVAAGADVTPLIHLWGIRPVEPARLKAAIAAKGIGSSMAVKALMLRYRTLIPANNAAFDAFFESVFPGKPAGVSPDYGAGWYQVRRTQWNESVAARAAGTIDTLIALYFPGSAAPQILNIDNSAGTVYDPATDGVLLMRYLFGLRGAALINNARGTGTSMRDAAQIEAYLAANLTRFDVDGDGKTLPMTDGLMILRRMLSPSTLTTNAQGIATITAGAKIGSRPDVDVVNAIDALRP